MCEPVGLCIFAGIWCLNSIMSIHISCPECGASVDVTQVVEKATLSLNEKQLAFEGKVAQARAEYIRQRDADKVQLQKEKEAMTLVVHQERAAMMQQMKTEFLQQQQQAQARWLEEKQTLEREKQCLEQDLKGRLEAALAAEREKIVLDTEKRLSEERALLAQKQDLQAQQRLLQQQKDYEEVIRRKELESRQFFQEQLLQTEQQARTIEKLQAQIRQGSMQLQGEAQELMVEEVLRRLFVKDRIAVIKQGKNGADIVQELTDEGGVCVGKILYEIKNAQNFSEAWVDKLKEDQITEKADIAVLVTTKMPAVLKRYGKYKGVWVLSLLEAEEFLPVVRGVLETRVRDAQKYKQLYGHSASLIQFVQSPEFERVIMRVKEVFERFRDNLLKEEERSRKFWLQRKKDLEEMRDKTVTLLLDIKNEGHSGIIEVQDYQLLGGREDSVSDGADVADASEA